MRKNKLPEINALDIPRSDNRISEQIQARWSPNIRAAKEDNNTITIYETIGYDPWTGTGFTAKRMAAALRSIGSKNDVIVSINSPGGSFFEGSAIYNLLREHKGNVTVKIIGIAASSASLIAMAADDIQISDIGFIMIHSVWTCVCGNKQEMRDAADTLQTFDDALADVYSARSGFDRAEIAEMLDKDTWLNASDAIEKGFADQRLDEDVVDEPDDDDSKKKSALAKRAVEMSLKRDGYSRKDIENLLNNAYDLSDSVSRVVRDADNKEGLQSLLEIITK